MPLTLEQYGEHLAGKDLTWPVAPAAQQPKAKPHLVKLSGIRLVAWNVYGTLLRILGGELKFVHPDKFVMDLALDKTVQEFKMWGSMSRKPGQPSEYMGQLYERALDEQRLASSPGEKHPEIHSDKIWDNIVKKLLQKEYKFDAGFYGALNEYCRKIAYFFHASIQGTAAYDGAGAAMEMLRSLGVKQGLLGDGQPFTTVQIGRAIAGQTSLRLDDLVDRGLRSLSFEVGGKKPSERLFRHFLQAAQQQGIQAHEILHIGSRILQDIAPARRMGMRTALFAGDKESLQVTNEQLKDASLRPDVLLTELSQVVDVLPSR
ncbi:MAG: HAD hydrolase-like protein [Gemmataceae bacterium]|nr:HAD hydrolase-like protein [Gemmataceae bacterium]